MYKFYIKYTSEYIASIFEFKPSETIVARIVESKEPRPIVDIEDEVLKDKGYHKLAGINIEVNKEIKPCYNMVYKGEDIYFEDNKDTNDAIFNIPLSYSLVQLGSKRIQYYQDNRPNEYRHPRSAIGKKPDGTVILAAIDSKSKRKRGLTAEESAEVMKEIGCVQAFNLDSGGSSHIIYKNRVSSDFPGLYSRPIKSALLVYSKKPLIKDHPMDYPILKMWSKGDYVAIVQNLLNCYGYSKGVVDGVFGPGLLCAVKQFQKKNKLVVTGVVNKEAWEKLLEKF